jgi:hypothetical protein
MLQRRARSWTSAAKQGHFFEEAVETFRKKIAKDVPTCGLIGLQSDEARPPVAGRDFCLAEPGG